MFVKTVAIGSEREAYVETRLTSGFNVIYSTEDNNKGKTLVIQSMMYSLGNNPIFPRGFPYDDYYHLCEVVDGETTYLIMRRKKSFSVLSGGRLYLYNSVSEYKRFIKSKLFDLPEILKDGRIQIVYPELFYQILFIGQDNRTCSNIVHNGLYNKNDFKEMIYSYVGIKTNELFENYDVEERIRSLRKQKEGLTKQLSVLKQDSNGAKQLFSVADKALFESKYKQMEDYNDRITELRKERNRVMQRKMKTESLIGELQQLNRSLDVGIVECNDCGSRNISYKSNNDSLVFDVSNKEIQETILDSLRNKVVNMQEECEEITRQIADFQTHLNSLLNEDIVSLESLMIYKNRNDFRLINDEIEEIDRELSSLVMKKKGNQNRVEDIKQRKEQLMTDIINNMNAFYKEIDPDGKNSFDDLFTVSNDTYSGSEATEFFLSRLYAYELVLKHPYPIIVDSFREGELSTDKEARVLSMFNQFSNQIIFTSTLKEEEDHKYDKDTRLNAICYDSNTTSHILNENDAIKMREYLTLFGIVKTR